MFKGAHLKEATKENYKIIRRRLSSKAKGETPEEPGAKIIPSVTARGQSVAPASQCVKVTGGNGRAGGGARGAASALRGRCHRRRCRALLEERPLPRRCLVCFAVRPGPLRVRSVSAGTEWSLSSPVPRARPQLPSAE